jgi:hypothetical protein
MGLFSKWFAKRQAPTPALFSERELEFNKKKLQDDLIRQSEKLYEYRSDESHRVFSDYVRQVLNLELLQLAEGKMDLESYAYRRGRVDALRNVINAREVHIQNKEMLRKSEVKDPDAQEAKRSYVRRATATNAGLSV